MSNASPGARFRAALKEERPLQIPGAINASDALLAKRAGFRAIYLSGGGVSAGSPGLPDLGLLTMDDVLTDIRRDGHQRNVVDTMQTREELYERIGYHTFEQSLDRTFAAKK